MFHSYVYLPMLQCFIYVELGALTFICSCSFRSHEDMSVLLLDSIVDKHAIDIENDYLKMVKVRIILLPVLV